jgi:hypothetical protein
MRVLTHILQCARGRPLVNNSERYGIAQLIERYPASMAAQTLALSTADGAQSWHDIALAAIEHGEEDFAGELVGFIERQLRQIS